ncbi:MAG: hypothetical protein CVT77_06290 [Alphaproteobacteria bacterium HGW-Alphaproteobacteria-16]|nr:MAG: hypothetical protein CVT77_06290 [Alphaproteobacteria bacterium HGW-Alphaproteobacteria-16]
MLERAFPKIAELTKARNDILHYGFNVDGEYAYVTNAERTILPRAFQFQMTVDSLDCLEADAITAYACLNSYCLARMAHPSITEEWIAAENEVALHAWRYKGARLTRHPDRNAEKPQDKKSQPLSSEA